MYLTTVFKICLLLYLNYDSCLCIKLYELNGYHSCIRLTFQSTLINHMARDRSLAMV
jgi:hypothetical protein